MTPAPYLADQLVTGEAVALELPPASIGLRILSGLLDLVVQLVVIVLGLMVVALAASDEATAAVGSILVVAGTLVIGPAVLETLTMGRTLGKLATGTRTVRDDAGPISFQHAFVRHLLSFVEIWVLSGVPALVSAVVSRKGKRLGDHLAGTYVVRSRVPLRLPWPVQMPPRLAGWAGGADLGPMPDTLAVSVRQFLARASTLSPGARAQLGSELLGQVLEHVSPPPPPGTHPEEALAAVAAERRHRDEQRLWREAELRRRLRPRAPQI